MRLTAIFAASMVFGFLGPALPRVHGQHADVSPGYDVACYYFPNYHMDDARNSARFGKGWSEWELVKNARPRWEGHYQPNIPAWGYTNESDPRIMELKIDAAANHGIDAFIFDWYYYDDGPFLEKCLESGYMEAANNDRVKFSLMWANHDWIDIHPVTLAELKAGPELIYPGKVTTQTWEKITDYVIENYFKHPSYWKINGAPYFSIYDLNRFMDIFGSKEATIEAVKAFREKVKRAGFSDLNLNAVVWGRTVLPSEEVVTDVNLLVKELGFVSTTSYVWIHHVLLDEFPVTPYAKVQAKYFEHAEKMVKDFDLPYYPNATMGWDSTPRAHQDDPLEPAGYPFMAKIGGNTPAAFKAGLVQTKKFLDANPSCGNVMNINCWNEWTEGSYLEPDINHGNAYLEAVRDVFGKDNVLFDGHNLDNWRSPVGEWLVAESVELDKSNPKAFSISGDNGIMVNGQAGRTTDILSKLEHGDVEAHIEFCVPKGSNSGVYFQGRYEIQVFDSWGTELPKYSDCGGIYQRWKNNKGYEGHAPLTNASRPPGVWQSFDIIFRAPRFDENGKKIENAKFVKVVHNGKVVHENVEVTGPTRAAKFGGQTEKPVGPLMLQGDHGPVAYRNIRLKPAKL